MLLFQSQEADVRLVSICKVQLRRSPISRTWIMHWVLLRSLGRTTIVLVQRANGCDSYLPAAARCVWAGTTRQTFAF